MSMKLQADRLAGQGEAAPVHKLTVWCKMPQLGTQYLDIYLGGTSLLLVFGGVNPYDRQYMDAVDLLDAPELKSLHDGRGWNLRAVALLVAGLETADVESFIADAGRPYPTRIDRPTA